jgi:hypothetical protein
MRIQTTEPPRTVTARSLRALIALSLACAFGIFAFAAAMGFTVLLTRSPSISGSSCRRFAYHRANSHGYLFV